MFQYTICEPLNPLVVDKGTITAEEFRTVLHNFPWITMLKELENGEVRVRHIKAFTFNRIRPDEFHRVELIEKDAWTLFFCDPRTKEGGYKDRKTLETIPWKSHLKHGSK